MDLTFPANHSQPPANPPHSTSIRFLALHSRFLNLECHNRNLMPFYRIRMESRINDSLLGTSFYAPLIKKLNLDPLAVDSKECVAGHCDQTYRDSIREEAFVSGL